MEIAVNAGTNQLKTFHIGSINMNTFGLNEYIIVVGDDVYELQGYAHDLATFMWELS